MGAYPWSCVDASPITPVACRSPCGTRLPRAIKKPEALRSPRGVRRIRSVDANGLLASVTGPQRPGADLRAGAPHFYRALFWRIGKGRARRDCGGDGLLSQQEDQS